MINLIQSKVLFSEAEHTYTLGDKSLSGITSILSRYLFPDKYSNSPKYRVDAARIYGKEIHQAIEMLNSGIDDERIEIGYYNHFLAEYGFKTIASEYLVSNNTSVASSIDLVCVNESGEIFLVDIKTTSQLDKEYLSWQLSTYAYLFEMQNPTLKVSGLVGLNIRKEGWKSANITRYDNEHIVALIQAYEQGAEQFNNPLLIATTEQSELLAQVEKLESALIVLKEQTSAIEKQKKVISEQLMQLMDSKGITKWELPNLTITRKADYVSSRIDATRLKAEKPDIYNSYLKESITKGTLLFNIKK